MKSNTTLNDTNAEKPSAQAEKPVEVLSTAESDLPVLQLFGDDVSGEPAYEASADVSTATEASHAYAWRHKRDLPDELGCHTGTWEVVTLLDGTTRKFPICKKLTVAGIACANKRNQLNQRPCMSSNYVTIIDVNNVSTAKPTTCSCAL